MMRHLTRTPRKFHRKLDAVCLKLDRQGVRVFRGGPGDLAESRRAVLLEHALNSGLVSAGDLGLVGRPSDRSSPAPTGRPDSRRVASWTCCVPPTTGSRTYRPHYTTFVDPIDGTELRVAHVDEGPSDADPILRLHGEPSWAYVIRVLVAAGHRVVAPDLIGFGRSDKSSERSDYTCARHVVWTTQWLEALDLQQVALVCQDWGADRSATPGLATRPVRPGRGGQHLPLDLRP